MVSLSQLQEVPLGKMVLLVGRPGSGKSTFCQQAALQSLAMDRSIVYVTTECGPSEAERLLREKGLGEMEPAALSFVDAYSETVGLPVSDRADTVQANCEDLSSIGIAISKLQDRIGRKGVLLIFDSLTSPYLLSGPEVVRFIRLTLSRFAGEGNGVLACFDEGCGKEEDLGAITSVADGIIKTEMRGDSRVISVVKHPNVAPTKIETPVTWSTAISFKEMDSEVLRRLWKRIITERSGQAARTEVGDFVNMFWRSLAAWSGMLWDPKGLRSVAYEADKEVHARSREAIFLAPWRTRLLLRLFIPKSLGKVKDMKKFVSRFLGKTMEQTGIAIWEYVEEASRRDEHIFRAYENCKCWGFDDIGARLDHCGQYVGMFKAFDKEERDWNMVETKCIAMGSPYCEFKVAPGEIDELKDHLGGIDSSVVERVHDRLMDQLVGFVVHERPLPERPRLGSGVMFNCMYHAASIPALFSERYRMALRLGGARAGKTVGQRLINAGMGEDEVTRCVTDFMDYCKIGKVTIGQTVRIRENCESFGLETGEPSCFFTTGFLNGFLSAVKNQHVTETRCIAMGDPHCEWEFR